MSGPGKALWYTHGRLEMRVNFPEDRTVCQWCPYCRSEESLKRWKCLLTGELLVYPFLTVGGECPIEFENKEN